MAPLPQPPGSTPWTQPNGTPSPIFLQYLLSLDGGTVVSVKVQKFTASGTYTPSAGMLYCIIEAVGGGGGGGGVAGTTNFALGGAGGSSGGYSRKYASAAAIGASQVVTIGAKGTGGAAGFNAGSAGGTTSVGSLCIANGGPGGNPTNNGTYGQAGSGAAAGTGDLAIAGSPGIAGFYFNTGGLGVAVVALGGAGANSPFGSSGSGAGNLAGGSATSFGAGGGGGATNVASNIAGGDGSPGVVFITEFCSQ